MAKGGVVVISGPSGVGKSTICRRICQALPAEFSVSMTTRAARPGESDGVHYHFVNREQFDRLLAADGFAEHAEVYGRHYGTPLEPVEAALRDSRYIVLEIDINGAIQVRSRLPEAKLIYLLPPTPEEQMRRITDRGTDSKEEIERRLARADAEMQAARSSDAYNLFVVNDDQDQAVAQILEFVRGA